MNYIKHTLDFCITEPSVISLGKFDGLHSGHRYLMEEMTAGKALGLKCVVFTFDVPPASFRGETCRVLSTNAEKAQIFEEAGADYLVECPFTDELRQMRPYDFLKMLTEKIRIQKIVAGTDFRFGYRRSGTYKDLLRYAGEFGYEAVIVQKKQYRGIDISSTRIRDCVVTGNLKEARELLGYDYFLSGPVVHGNEIGRTIGIPTANQIPPKEKLLPPNGVYAIRAQVGAKCCYGISNVGRKPTIGGGNPIGVETHLFDFSGDLYGQELRVSFLRFIRREQKFSSLGELQARMEKDIQICRESLAADGRIADSQNHH